MNKQSTAYNQVVSDMAARLSDVLAETLYAAGHLHLMNTNPTQARYLRETGHAIVIDEDVLLNNADPNVRRIMQAHDLAARQMKILEAYWLTTSNWAEGESI